MTSTSPKVSVIIPTYNREKLIIRAIESVLAQTYKDFEIVVVDDGSSDATKTALAPFDGKIKYIYQDNAGIALARNRGIKESAGDYIAFLDSDDYWVPEKLAEQVKILDAYPKVGIVFAPMPIVNENGETLGRKPAGKTGKNLKELLEHWGDLPTSTVMTRRECFEKAGVFDPALPPMEDFDMWLRIARYYDLHEIEGKILAYYYRHSKQTTSSKLKVYEGLVKSYTKALKSFPEAPRKLMRARISSNQYTLSRIHFDEGRCQEAFVNLVAAMKHYPLIGILFFHERDGIFEKLIKFMKPYGYLAICFFQWVVCGCFLKGWLYARMIFKIHIINNLCGEKKAENPAHKLIKKQMRIAIDISRALESNKTGIPIYQFCLFKSLLELGSVHYFIPMVYGATNHNGEQFMNQKILSLHNQYGSRNVMLKNFTDRILMNKQMPADIDIVHATAYHTIGGFEKMSVITIHDLIFMKDPYYYNKFTVDLLRHNIRKVRKIIAVSQVTKNEILLEFPFLPEDKIVVIYEGARDSFFCVQDNEKLENFKRSEFGDEHLEYILFLGSFTKRKNVLNIILAYDLLVKRRRITHKLVLVGKAMDMFDEVIELIRELGLEQFVIIKNYLDDESMPYLLSSADVFVFPSFAEGFGLPVIEAMQCGCPCVVSNVSSLQELFAKAALSVDPSSPGDISDAIYKLISNPQLREKYRELGFKKAREFSWEKTAQDTLRMYESII